jgi:hypothetical protein
VLDLIVIHDDLGWPDFAAVASTAGAATQALKLSSCVVTKHRVGLDCHRVVNTAHATNYRITLAIDSRAQQML